MKLKELQMAKMMLDRLYKKYPSMFEKDGKLKWPYGGECDRDIAPTQVKDEIRYIRRLLMEVSREL